MGDEIMSYVGQWSVEEPEVVKGIDGDAGLVMSTSSLAFFTISDSLFSPL